uniref:Ig-like domain-containing protein n=1 Tax=Sander lucioperca TaxID=283035 RepID=A0A8D0AGC3_SANLU
MYKNGLLHVFFYLPGPEVIKVEEGSDVTLPCSLWPKDIQSTQFNWKKMSQNDESQMEVFLYDKGERPDQSEQFKGRVSHFPDKLKQGNASIIIRNTTRADSGEYRCKIFYINYKENDMLNRNVTIHSTHNSILFSMLSSRCNFLTILLPA